MSLSRHVSQLNMSTNFPSELLWAWNSQTQVDPDAIIDSLKGMHMSEAGQKHVHTHGGMHHITPYSTRYASKQEISKFRIPDKGAPADAVHQMLKDELDLDGRPNLNLARWVIRDSL